MLELKPITTDNALDQLQLIIKISEKNDHQRLKSYENIIKEESINKMISFISSYFFELDQEKIQLLPSCFITEILDREELQVESEDSLLHFIIEKYKEDERYSELFEKVYFNNVSEDALKEFIGVFNINDL